PAAVSTVCPVATSHNRNCPSQLLLPSSQPEWLNPTLTTLSSCFCSSFSFSPVNAFQMKIHPFSQPTARCIPSLLQTQLETWDGCESVLSRLPSRRSLTSTS